MNTRYIEHLHLQIKRVVHKQSWAPQAYGRVHESWGSSYLNNGFLR